MKSAPVAYMITPTIAAVKIKINSIINCALAQFLSDCFLVPPHAQTISIINPTIGIHDNSHMPIQLPIETGSYPRLSFL